MANGNDKLNKKMQRATEKANAALERVAKLVQRLGQAAVADSKYDFASQHADEYYETLIENPV